MEFRAVAILAVAGLLMIAYGSVSHFIAHLPLPAQYAADGAWAAVGVGVVVALMRGFMRADRE